MQTRTPIVNLVNYSEGAEDLVYWNFQIMNNPNYPDFPAKLPEEKKKEFFDMVRNTEHLSFLECVNLTFSLENVSRAFQQQLTRTRTAWYCIQSLRIVDVGNFYDKGSYYLSSKVKSEDRYHKIFKYLQEQYRVLIEEGEAVEDARGILPLNIHSPIHVGINFRNFAYLLSLRLCRNAQDEYRIVANKMVEEVRKVMPYLVDTFIKSKCDRDGFCSEIEGSGCGKYLYR